MIIRSIAILVAAASLAACASPPAPHVAVPDAVWNGGIWNSMLGYHGPANATVMGGPSR